MNKNREVERIVYSGQARLFRVGGSGKRIICVNLVEIGSQILKGFVIQAALPSLVKFAAFFKRRINIVNHILER